MTLWNVWQAKPLDEVLYACRELLDDTNFSTVNAWKQGGGKVLGHFQVYFPEEIAHAAGTLPVKVRGAPIEARRGDSHFGSYLCSILRTSLDLGLTGKLPLDMFVTHPICDAARNLAGIWGRNFSYPSQILYLPQNANSAYATAYLRDEYARRLAGLVGAGDPLDIVARVRGLVRSGEQRSGGAGQARPVEPDTTRVDEAVASVEREVLKIALQLPAVAGPQFDTLAEDAFLLPAHQKLRRAIAAAGGTAAAVSGPAWTSSVEASLPDEALRSGVHALAVEPLRAGADSQDRYADAVLARLHEIVAGRQVAALKSKLQRINPIEAPEEHARLFGELISLESYRRSLRERAIGGQ